MSFNSNVVDARQSGNWAFSVNPSAVQFVISNFNSVSSVASGILTTIVSYTVPPAKSTYLCNVEVSGSNIARYDIYINSVLSARQRTEFTELNTNFIFNTASSNIGFKLATGTVVEIKVIHNRPFVGDFEARLLAVEEG